MTHAELRRRTRGRILDGAADAVARHGLAKLDIADVSRSAGVSRGTIYRYFSNREELFDNLAVREADHFWKSLISALEEAPEADARIRLLLLHATSHVREHPALQRILETDPALVLRAVQERFPVIRSELRRLVGPLLESNQLVRSRVATVSQLVDLLTRLLVSAYLIPAPKGEGLLDGITAIFSVLTVQPEAKLGAPRAKES